MPGARATTSDQPIAPSPNEQNIKPPTLHPVQSFFSSSSTSPKLRVFRTAWPSMIIFSAVSGRRRMFAGGPGLSACHDRFPFVVFPAPTNWMQSLQAEGQHWCHSARP